MTRKISLEDGRPGGGATAADAEPFVLCNAMEAMLNTCSDSVFVVDRHGRCLAAGKTGARLLGATAAEMIGQALTAFGLTAEAAAELTARMECVFQTDQPHTTTILVSTVLGPHLYEYHLSPLLDGRGKTTALLCLARQGIDLPQPEGHTQRPQAGLAEHTQAEDSLRATQERYRFIVENAQEGIWMIGPDTTTVYVNSRMAEMLGCSVADMLGRSSFEFVFPEDMPKYQHVYHMRKEGVANKGEVRLRKRDGTELWTLLSSNPMHDEAGRFCGVVGLHTDLTERKKQEAEIATLNQALQQRLEELETIFKTVPAAVCIAEDTACRRIRGNPAACEMLRVPEGANVSKTAPPEEAPAFRIFHHGQEADSENLPMQVAARTGQHVRDIEWDIVWEDGVNRHWYGGASPLFDAQGAVRGSVGVFVDITPRKQAEAKLRHSEECLRLALDAASMVAWDWNIVTGEVSRRGDLAGILGMEPTCANGVMADLLSLIHHEDRATFAAACQSAQTENRNFHAQYRLVRPDGAVRWIDDIGRVTRDAAGDAVRLSGVLRDVTAQKMAEDERVRQQAQIAVLQERNRMAQEIHDTLAQGFTGIVILLEAARGYLGTEMDQALSHFDLATDLARASLTEARRSVQALRSTLLQNTTLPAALARLIEQSTLEAFVEGELVVQGQERALPADVEDDLLRIGQEALSNALRHGHPTLVQMELTFTDDTVQLRLRDNGIGFDTQSAPPEGHYGLTGMRERAERVHGTLVIQSQEGQGTEVWVVVPDLVATPPK